MTQPIRAYDHHPRSEGLGLMYGECAEYPRRKVRAPFFLSLLAVIGFFGCVCFAATILGAIR